MDKQNKTEIIEKYRVHDKDVGSTEVQVAIITDRIGQLTTHLATHRHDYHTQRGLLKMVGSRRRLLGYLSRNDVARYNKLIKALGLRK